MRLSFFITFLVIFGASANVSLLSQKVSLDYTNTEIREVFRSLREQTGHMIIYSSDDLNPDQTKVSVKVNNVELSEALDLILSGLPYTYVVREENVMIIPKTEVVPRQQAPRSVTIAGTVSDQEGSPLPGAAVINKGNNQGITVGTDGKFQLTATEGSVIEISYLGYETQRFVVEENRTTYNVVLSSGAVEVETVTITTGYQNISKGKVTGSVVSLGADQLQERYTPNILDNLEGKVAGLVTYDGKTVIRGTSSFNANTQPLLVVDGLPIEGKLEDLNPYDIASVNVLKDAAATAIYGARASNGIIVVTTKSAPGSLLADGKSISVDISANTTIYEKKNVGYRSNFYMTPAEQVDLDAAYYDHLFFGTENIISNDPISDTKYGIDTYRSLNPIEHAYYQLALGEIDRSDVNSLLDRLRNNNYAKDYAKHILQRRILQQYNVAVRSRSERFQSNLVVNYKHDNTEIRKGSDNSFNIFYKGSYNMAKWLTVNFGVNSILQNQNSSKSVTADPFQAPAYYSLFNPDGSLASLGSLGNGFWNETNNFDQETPEVQSFFKNPLQELDYDRTKSDRHNTRFQGDLLFRIADGLTVNTLFMYEAERNNESTYYQPESYTTRELKNMYTFRSGTEGNYSYYSLVPTFGGVFAGRNMKGDYWTARAQANYNRTFAGVHSIDFIGGFEFRQTKYGGTKTLYLGYDEKLQIDATSTVDLEALSEQTYGGFIYSGYNAKSMVYNPLIVENMGPVTEEYHRFGSGYFNATYTYDSRYNVFGSFRKDYADVFGLNAKFRGKPLWSVGASWNIHNESFTAGMDRISFLKLRFSYGVTGNIYQGASSYLTAESAGFNTITSMPMTKIYRSANPSLKWEKTTTVNIGVDFGFFANRLRGSLDYYDKTGDDIFSNRSLDPSFGFEETIMNVAKIKNAGIELAVSYDWFVPRARGDFNWSTSVTATFNKNEVKRLDVKTTTAGAQLDLGYEEGKPLGSIYAYRFGGMDGMGRPTAVDINGETLIQNAASASGKENLVYMGQIDPKYVVTMENSLRYKGFYLSFMMVYYGGHKMRAGIIPEYWRSFASSGLSVHSAYNDSWTPENTDTIVPGFGPWGASVKSTTYSKSDIFVKPADFLKVRNIVLGYDMPRQLISKIGLVNLRVNFQIDNPKYLWVNNDFKVDPETLSVRRPASYILGLNFNF